MTATKIIELLTAQRYTDLAALAERELREEAAKAAGGASAKKRQQTAERLLNRGDNARPLTKKAWMHDGKQCLTNGYVGFLLDDAIPLPMHETAPDFPLHENFKNLGAGETVAADWGLIAAEEKLHRTKKTGTPCTVRLGNSLFNAEYLLTAKTILGGDKLHIETCGGLRPLYMTSENGAAIVLPVRAKDDETLNATVDVTIRLEVIPHDPCIHPGPARVRADAAGERGEEV